MPGRRAVEHRSLPRHAAFYGSIVVGAVVFVAGLALVPAFAVAIGANAMFVTYLALIAYEFGCLTPEFLRRRAADADSPVAAFFVVVAAVVGVAVAFLFLALNGGGTPDLLAVGTSVVSVLLGWFTIHTMAGLHYAYEYYEEPKASDSKAGSIVGGLAFPKGDEPDGSAFLYFAFVVGMTAQVADVAVTSNAMRRLVLIHGIFAFLFNTILVAATVNVVVTVAGS